MSRLAAASSRPFGYSVALSRLRQYVIDLALALGLSRFPLSKSGLASVQCELSLVSGPCSLLRRWLLAHVTKPDQVRWQIVHRYAHARKESAASMRHQSWSWPSWRAGGGHCVWSLVIAYLPGR